jgi:putative tricarboxylic transport membrane protein
MRAAFLLVILALATFYTYLAFAELSWLTRAGRLGPGYFPRIIGIGIIVLCLYSLVADARRAEPQERISPHWTAAVAVALLSIGFVALLDVLGGLLAMFVFMLASLWYLNRGRPVMNIAIATILPVSVYMLFVVWLNAAMPRGMFPLPL